MDNSSFPASRRFLLWEKLKFLFCSELHAGQAREAQLEALDNLVYAFSLTHLQYHLAKLYYKLVIAWYELVGRAGVDPITHPTNKPLVNVLINSII